jgi:hypothetical protein
VNDDDDDDVNNNNGDGGGGGGMLLLQYMWFVDVCYSYYSEIRQQPQQQRLFIHSTNPRHDARLLGPPRQPEPQ